MLLGKKIYADHSATTPVREEVVEVMSHVLKEDFGNPSSIHCLGRNAKKHLTEARKNIASVINAREEEIFFTSSGTEANNAVIFGIERLVDNKGLNKDKHIVATKIEHSAVKVPLEYLEKKGWKVSWLNVDSEGFINVDQLSSSIRERTALVSIIHANNEIGVIQDLKKISAMCKDYGVLFHSDAIQSFCKVPIDVQKLQIDFMSFSGHKIYGPKGVGALFIRSPNMLPPLILGGGQENNFRSGTENLPGIVGFGVAAKFLSSEMHAYSSNLGKLQIELIERLKTFQKDGNFIFTGPSREKYLCRLPGHVSICVKGQEGESLVLQMDLKGVCVSSGSACSNKKQPEIEPSHVLLAIGVNKEYAKGSLRITFGRDNTVEDVEYIAESLQSILSKMKTPTRI